MAAMRVTLLGICALALTAGCTFDTAGSGPPDEIPGDNPGAEILDCAEWNPAPAYFDPCELGELESALSLFADGEYIYDTDTSELFSPADELIAVLPSVAFAEGNIALRALFVEAVEVGPLATLRARGSRALVIASWSKIQIAGTLDVSSGLYGDGAGGNLGCSEVSTRNGASSDPLDKGASGGAGGSLFKLGGNGAVGAIDGGEPLGGTATGLFKSASSSIHPGCAGGTGGVGTNPEDSGARGSGGGAVLLAARNTVSIAGHINAGGAGGLSGINWGGGGGGGSGGFIGVAANAILISGELVAHGGAGAGAASHNVAGEPGQDARDSSITLGAAGGIGINKDAGDGGDGAACTVDAQSGAADKNSGGGGGGGIGEVVLTGHAVLQLTPGAYVTGHQCR